MRLSAVEVMPCVPLRLGMVASEGARGNVVIGHICAGRTLAMHRHQSANLGHLGEDDRYPISMKDKHNFSCAI